MALPTARHPGDGQGYITNQQGLGASEYQDTTSICSHGSTSVVGLESHSSNGKPTSVDRAFLRSGCSDFKLHAQIVVRGATM